MFKFMYFDLTFTKKEIVMKIENINIPPRPYKCKVRLPLLSMRGIETNVIRTITVPIPIVAYFAFVSLSPVVINKFVE